MATRLVQVNFKAHDETALGAFWAAALGWGQSSEGPGVANVEPPDLSYPDPATLWIDLVRSSEPKTGKNRVHLDLASTDQAALVARLTALGAKPVDIGQGDVEWEVMADPEGNEFCVLDWHDPDSDTGPIASVVVDSADPEALAEFWIRATDWQLLRVTDHSAVLRSAAGVGPYLQFLRSTDPKVGWNRLHLDIRPYPHDNLEKEAVRLTALGAEPVELDVPWKVFRDPEGNEFCLLTPH